ncbi:hypothetical protein ACFQYP_63600 [Nonomuraea antimicrobica]
MNIADLARVRDEDLAGEPVGQASGAGARALMESIMTEAREPAGGTLPARPRRFTVRRGLGRGLGLGVPAAALTAALVLWAPFGGPTTEYANAAVSLETRPNVLFVAVNDPEADAATFTQAFQAVGLAAEVRKAPVAPEDVGKLIGPVADGDFPRAQASPSAPGRRAAVLPGVARSPCPPASPAGSSSASVGPPRSVSLTPPASRCTSTPSATCRSRRSGPSWNGPVSRSATR